MRIIFFAVVPAIMYCTTLLYQCMHTAYTGVEDNDGYSPVSTSLLSCYDNDLDPDMLVTVVRMAASHCSKDEKERLLFAICEQYHEFLDIVKLLVEECNFRLKGK